MDGILIAPRAPFLLFTGTKEDAPFAKTARGLAFWRPEACLGQWGLERGAADIGLPEMGPTEARRAGANSLVIGVAPIGGVITQTWCDALVAAANAGLDIVSGMHVRLSTIARLREAAEKSGISLVDLRSPPANLPIASGRRRTGHRVLTVGTDCALGKKYTALALAKEMQARGLDASFRASGQTGILIAGAGIPIDAVVSDFVAGAAELLSPDASVDHWDVIEGQGSLFHPAYAGVSLGLLHGSQPDAIVVCHEPGRATMLGWPDYRVPDVKECIETNLTMGRLTNSAIRCAGVSCNTSAMKERDRAAYLSQLSTQLRLPCVDPLVDGVTPIVDMLLSQQQEAR